MARGPLFSSQVRWQAAKAKRAAKKVAREQRILEAKAELKAWKEKEEELRRGLRELRIQEQIKKTEEIKKRAEEVVAKYKTKVAEGCTCNRGAVCPIHYPH